MAIDMVARALASNLNVTVRYKNYEEKTINSGSNTMIISTSLTVNNRLRIVDTKYGQEWLSPTHYTLSGQTVTLTESALSEALTFQIWIFEKDV